MKKIKTCSYILCSIGLLSVLTCIAVPFIRFTNYTAQNGSVGIIGGADTPMALFILHGMFNGWMIYPFVFGLTFVICSLFALIFSKAIQQHCSGKTTAVSLGLSFAGTAGLSCLFIRHSIAAFHETATYSVLYPASVIGTILSFAAFLSLLVWYFFLRKNRFSFKGLLIDSLTCVIFFPSFFFVCAGIYDMLQRLIA